MRRTIIAIATLASLTMGTSAVCFAQGSSQNAPGQRMQDQGSVPGHPGASGYAPGQQMQEKGSMPGQPGASGYAPGHQSDTTGQNPSGGDMRGGSRGAPAR